MSLIAASEGKRAQITVSPEEQRLHWWASLKLRQRRNHKSSLVCILNNEVLILKFVDSALVEAFIHASPLNSSRRSQKKLRKSFLFLPALFSVLLQKCSLYCWAGWLKVASSSHSTQTAYCCRRSCRELITVKFGKTDQRAGGKKHLLYLWWRRHTSTDTCCHLKITLNCHF